MVVDSVLAGETQPDGRRRRPVVTMTGWKVVINEKDLTKKVSRWELGLKRSRHSLEQKHAFI